MNRPVIYTSDLCLSPEQLSRLRRGGLSAPERKAVDEHLLNCPFCADAAEGALFVQSELTVINSELHEKIDEKLQEKKQRFGWWKLAAAAVFIAIAGGTYYLLEKRAKDEFKGMVIQNESPSLNRKEEISSVASDAPVETAVAPAVEEAERSADVQRSAVEFQRNDIKEEKVAEQKQSNEEEAALEPEDNRVTDINAAPAEAQGAAVVHDNMLLDKSVKQEAAAGNAENETRSFSQVPQVATAKKVSEPIAVTGNISKESKKKTRRAEKAGAPATVTASDESKDIPAFESTNNSSLEILFGQKRYQDCLDLLSGNRPALTSREQWIKAKSLSETGKRGDAIVVLKELLKDNSFSDRPQAEKLLSELEKK